MTKICFTKALVFFQNFDYIDSMPNNPIFVALDLDDAAKALSIAKQVEPFVGGFKVGPRLILREGASFVKKLAAMKPVFIDNKYFDIPSTMDAAIRATFEMGATYATIHAQSGSEAMKLLAQTEQELNQQRPFKILAVTILTSFAQNTLPPNSNKQDIATQVVDLASITIQSGLTGLVCSPHEAEILRSRHNNAFLVTPGIRLDGNAGDQKRIMGPKEAIKAGASALVIGRPIVEAKDPRAVAEQCMKLVQA